MFSDNQRISRRQLERQLLLGLSGVFLMVLPQIPGLYGWSGILGIVLGTLILWVLLFFLVRTTAVAKGLRERISPAAYKWFAFFYLTYLVLSGGFIVRMSAEMISRVLLPDYQPWVIGILFIVAAFVGTGSDLQRRGRLGEVSCVCIVGGLFLLIVLSALQIAPSEISTIAPLTVRGVAESAYHTFCAFSVIGILPFLMHQVERPQSSLKNLWRATGIAAVLAASVILVIQLLFGIDGVGEKQFPVTSLMAAVNVPGGFLDRFDAVWMVFLLFSLLYSGGTVFYYGRHLWDGKAALVLIPSVFAAAFLQWQGKNVYDFYPWCVRCFYVPLFALFGLCLSKFRRKT